MPHPEPDHPLRRLGADDAWLAEWAGAGLERLERLLALYAAFDRFVADRERTRAMHAPRIEDD